MKMSFENEGEIKTHQANKKPANLSREQVTPETVRCTMKASYSALTAITEVHRLNGLNNRNTSLTLLEVGKFKFRVKEWVHSGPLSSSLQVAIFLFPRMAEEGLSSLLSLLTRAIIPS